MSRSMRRKPEGNPVILVLVTLHLFLFSTTALILMHGSPCLLYLPRISHFVRISFSFPSCSVVLECQGSSSYVFELF
ncbi:hypothetical protein BDR03DRAFT_940066 [Suillus americanus]|nr:hypothetical protein BDR03DRAFT_940066 [Suillus americanus]